MSGASANSGVIRSPRLCGFHQRDEGDQRSNLSPCLLSASDPEFAYARGFYVWSPDSGVLPFKARVLQFTGIPVSVGIASTKCLTKVANEIVKKDARYDGVLDFTA